MHEPKVPIPGPLHAARFVERPNRFLIRCALEADGDEVIAHLADRGRLEATLVPGRRLWLRPATGAHRKTAWTAALAETTPDGHGLLSLDTTLPNRLVGEALRAGAIDELKGWTLEKPEWRHGRSRIDFLLGRPDGERLALEVKSVGLVEGDVALFPDGVTARGARHLRELAELAGRDGWMAAILFVVQREDARRVAAAAHIDPDFAAALEEARAAGVRVYARRCKVTLDGVALGPPLPVD